MWAFFISAFSENSDNSSLYSTVLTVTSIKGGFHWRFFFPLLDTV
jgi:hypothetical protein